MRKHQMTLISDFYKQAHAEQYPENMDFIASYFIPRMSRLKNEDSLIVFGIQGFVNDYLVERFNETFFNIPCEEVIREYERVIKHTLTKDYCEPEKIRELHKLGYLPIEIKALPEGTKCPIKVPMIEITSTTKGFEWVVQFIESIMSCQLWYPMTVANQAYRYRQIVNKYFDISVDENIPRHSAISEFGFRGAEGQEGAILASAAFLTSFSKTATIPAILYLEDYYRGNIENGDVASGMISTEHSVMCSNYSVDGDEKTFVKKLLSEIYPTGNVSMVSDSYDYWNLITNILGSEDIKEIIQSRKGILYVRGDSGDPVDIICGTFKEPLIHLPIGTQLEDYCYENHSKDFKNSSTFYKDGTGPSNTHYFKIGDKYFEVDFIFDGRFHIQEFDMTVEMKGTVEALWDVFGGTFNSKGYKVLAPTIRAVYGDSITPKRAEEIYQRLTMKGFAVNNVALGAGSFSMQCAEELNYNNGTVLSPFTRDTYGIAIKATYVEVNGKPVEVFKNPKTDNDNFKKSNKGMCYVYRNSEGCIDVLDGFTRDSLPPEKYNLLQTVFKDGKVYNQTSIYEIRERLHNDKY